MQISIDIYEDKAFTVIRKSLVLSDSSAIQYLRDLGSKFGVHVDKHTAMPVKIDDLGIVVTDYKE